LKSYIIRTTASTDVAISIAVFMSDYFAFLPYKTASANGFIARHHKVGNRHI